MIHATAGAVSLLLVIGSSAQDPDTARIDSFMIARMEMANVPGAAVAIVRNGRVLHVRGYGEADDSGRPVTSATPFTLGSATKSFTALAVLQLAEDGRIELDAPIQRYLPWFRVSDAAAGEITVRQLLQHTSGLSTRTGNLTQWDRDTSAAALERRVRALANADLAAAPGERFAYSNANYQTLGALIEAVSAQRYEAYVRDHILDPLGMRDSHLSEREALAADATPGYTLRFGKPVQARELGLRRGSVAQGGMVSSARDLGRYLTAVMGGAEGAHSVVPDGVRETLLDPGPQLGPGQWYAAGWYVAERDDERTIWHGGDSPQGKAALLIAPERDLGVAVLLNVNHGLLGQPMIGIVNGVFSLLLDSDPPPPPGRGMAWLVVALLALVPILVAASVFRTAAMLRRWRRPGREPAPGWRSWVLRVALPSLLMLGLAWLVLFAVPAANGANLSAVRLFAPDLWWLMIIGGGSAVLWAAVRPVLVGRDLRERPAASGRAVAPAAGKLPLLILGLGLGLGLPPAPAAAQDMASGLRFRFMTDFGLMEYTASEEAPLFVEFAGASDYQIGLTPTLALLLGGEAIGGLGSTISGGSDDDFARVSAWGARAFAGVNWTDRVHVGAGLMGRNVIGRAVNGRRLWGDAGLVLAPAVRGSLLLGFDRFNIIGHGWTTMGSASGGDASFSESQLRVGIDFGGLGGGAALHDWSYDPGGAGDDPGGEDARSLGGTGWSLYFSVHLN